MGTSADFSPFEFLKNGEVTGIDVEIARKIGSRILFMDDGKILEDETPYEFFENPRHERIKEFLSKIL